LRRQRCLGRDGDHGDCRPDRGVAHHETRKPSPPLAAAATQRTRPVTIANPIVGSCQHNLPAKTKESRMSKIKWLAAGGVDAALVRTGCSAQASQSSGGTTNVGASSGTKVSLMVGGLNKQIYLPFTLAQQLGYYQDEGLNISLSDEPAGVDATTNML